MVTIVPALGNRSELSPVSVSLGMAAVFATGIQMGESRRWHDGRFWMCDWLAGEVLVFDADGNGEVAARVNGLPFSIDWLRDGRLVATTPGGVVAGPALVALPDEQILARAASTGRALVTANIKDFIPLDARYRVASQAHAGLILVSAKTFSQDRSYTAAVTSALSALVDQSPQQQPGQVTFLRRR